MKELIRVSVQYASRQQCCKTHKRPLPFFSLARPSFRILWAWSGVVVKALRYYSEGPGIDSRWCHWIFQWHIPSDRIMALGSTQALVKMSTSKGSRCVRLTTSPPSCAECHEIWEPKSPGTLWATPGLLRDCFTSLPSLRILIFIYQTKRCIISEEYIVNIHCSENLKAHTQNYRSQFSVVSPVSWVNLLMVEYSRLVLMQ